MLDPVAQTITAYAQILGTCGELGVPCTTATNDRLTTILNAIFLLIGSLSVIFIIVGGLQYVLSGGNPEITSKAKNTILYAIVGLIVSLSAAAIVNFVIGSL